MKLAVIVTLGPLNKYGYQHTSLNCLQNLVAFADRLYIIRSQPGRQDLQGLQGSFNNITLISAPVTWFQGGYYDIRQILFNEHICLARAGIDGYDAAVILSCNWYVPKPAGEYLRSEADGMLTLKLPYSPGMIS